MSKVIQKLEKIFGRFTFPYLLAVLLAGQAVMFFAVMAGEIREEFLFLNGRGVLSGEIWRTVSFMFFPLRENVLFFGLYVLITYFMGTAVEREWGEFKFSLFLGTGWLVTVLLSLAFPAQVFVNFYIMGTVLMAFAWLHPNYEIRAYFLFPLKVKYFGYFYLAKYLLDFIGGNLNVRLMVGACLIQLLLFFGGDLLRMFQQKKRSADFRKQVVKDLSVPFHQCSECERNDRTHPDASFRYEGETCICEVCLEKRKRS